ncbi:restriction endonuclease subunit S [Bifidobacterium adolescentis]|uniref:restriction endonuclease subunit S n=1 Tax=Bifidobacterium adolescentis TaxID=1680 RepID=UPI0022E777A7|nr:restriction endonuclease subunit S [Bifidobacterium adolescentis]
MAEQHEKALVPQIRFTGFTDPWEQRKLGELVEIERGGSPRPIEQYITDDPCGLNWVKIGDAPELGRYITKTAEKIKPEGLSKTRQVYPGDLVLSNSMSFGRPYIMAIKGCVHDGWLLIRDAQKHFDPIFLCHMLGAPQMLNQYRMFAAGSTVNNLNKELVGNAIVSLPSKNEQHEIGIALDRLDSLITLHQGKYDKLCVLKKSMLDKMFPKGGSLYPEIRFAGFTDPWEQRKLGELASKRIEKNTNGIKETFTNSAEHGVVSQLDYFDHDITNDANIGNYSVVHPDDFIYNPRISAVAPCGPINRNKLDRNGVMSPLYTVFSVDDTIDKLYLEHYFKTSRWHQFMFLEGNSGARSDRFSISDSIFFEMPIQCPVLEEQELIASFFGRLDSLITLHQRKLELLRNIKKSMLDKMFV